MEKSCSWGIFTVSQHSFLKGSCDDTSCRWAYMWRGCIWGPRSQFSPSVQSAAKFWHQLQVVSPIKFSDECASCVTVTNTWHKCFKERRPHYSSWSIPRGPMYLDRNSDRARTWGMRSIHYREDKAESEERKSDKVCSSNSCLVGFFPLPRLHILMFPEPK